jgi:mono/diheme cytochrome c family protein
VVTVLAGVVMGGAAYLQAVRMPVVSPALTESRTTSVPTAARLAPAATQIAGAPRETEVAERRGALIGTYCVGCHNARLKTGGLVLEGMSTADVSQHADVWEKVARKVRAGSMPPVGRPRPGEAAASAFVDTLERDLDRASTANLNPGRRPSVHRLNRAEYSNAIADLLALEVDVRTLLPGDDADQHGFDNMADVLTVSPSLLERYMGAARKITRLALGRPVGLTGDTFRVPRMLFQDGRMSEDLPFGSRGGFATAYNFPTDGEYALRVKLQTNLYSYIRGLARPHQLEVRVDGARVKVFTVGGEFTDQMAPASYAGAMFGSKEWEKYAHDADAGLETRFAVKAGRHVLGVSFAGDTPILQEGPLQPRQVGYPLAVNEMSEGNPSVEDVIISGPYHATAPSETPSRRRLFVCRPAGPADEARCARTIIATLLRRAYRRPVTDRDLDAILPFFEAGRHNGDFETGIQMALERVLADPEFLFRIENDPPDVPAGTPYPITNFELAARLSFFLWSSIPDDALLEAASRGQLREPAVLQRQAQRLLAAPRARKALVDNFAGQWLELRNLRGALVDPDLFKGFDENVRSAFARETELFLDEQLEGDHPIPELLDANYTFLNEMLAKYYQVPNVYGDRFRKVTLPPGSQRRGLLGQGSILTVTSYPNRTSPVLRGKWVLTNVL